MESVVHQDGYILVAKLVECHYQRHERCVFELQQQSISKTYILPACSVMCQLPIELNYRKSRANYRHIVYVWSTDKFTERGRAISGRSIEAYPPVFDFARFWTLRHYRRLFITL